MSTTQQDKPAAKPRQRSRKADRRGQKSEQPPREALERLDQGIIKGGTTEETVAPVARSVDDMPENDRSAKEKDVSAMELPADAMLANGKAEPSTKAELKVESSIKAEPDMEPKVERPAEPLSGEVLLPVRMAGKEVSHTALGPLAVAESWRDYARKSLQARKALVDRLMKVRSFEDAIQAHGEFARFAYANFVAESCKLCELHGEWTREWLRPFENAAAIWTRPAR